MGRRTELVVVGKQLRARLENPDPSPQQQDYHRWWREALLTRLTPQGKVLSV